MWVCKPQIKHGRYSKISTESSLAHTKWECKYHVVFAPKYRRQVIYKREDVPGMRPARGAGEDENWYKQVI